MEAWSLAKENKTLIKLRMQSTVCLAAIWMAYPPKSSFVYVTVWGFITVLNFPQSSSKTGDYLYPGNIA